MNGARKDADVNLSLGLNAYSSSDSCPLQLPMSADSGLDLLLHFETVYCLRNQFRLPAGQLDPRDDCFSSHTCSSLAPKYQEIKLSYTNDAVVRIVCCIGQIVWKARPKSWDVSLAYYSCNNANIEQLRPGIACNAGLDTYSRQAFFLL